MAERIPTYTAAGAGDTIDYKPLSLLAVGGFGVAVFYAVVLAVGAVASLVKGEPFFMGGWSFGMAIAGALLSVLGLYQVYNSEGTRAGAALAKWGLGISVVVGLGYFTYHTFTGLAILQQADHFLMTKDENAGFFPRLQASESDVNTAFLFTLGDVASRGVRVDSAQGMAQFDRPLERNPKGMLTQFLENPLVRLLRQTPPGSTKVEALSVRSWAFENGAYSIVRNYRITTDEAVYEVPLQVVSIEPAAEGEKRRWRALNFNPLEVIQRTELGLKRQALRQMAFGFLTDPKSGWLELINQRRDPVDIYLATQRPQDRKLLRELAGELRRASKVLDKQGPLAALGGASLAAAGPATEDQLLKRGLRGYHPLSQLGEYFKFDHMRIWDPAKQTRVKILAKITFSLPQMVKMKSDDLAPFETRGDEMLCTFQAYAVNGTESTNVLFLAKVVVAAPAALDPAAADADQQWYVKSAELYRALEIPPQKLPG